MRIILAETGKEFELDNDMLFSGSTLNNELVSNWQCTLLLIYFYIDYQKLNNKLKKELI
jgi:hypothetical protein